MPAMSRCAAIVTAVLAILIAGCGGWNAKAPAWSNATGAEQFERLWWDDVKTKNWKRVEYRMAATYVSVTPKGARDRERTLASLKQLDIADFSLGDVEVRPNAHDLVITYTMSLRGTMAGKPVAIERASMMTVWQHQKSGWIAIAHTHEADF